MPFELPFVKISPKRWHPGWESVEMVTLVTGQCADRESAPYELLPQCIDAVPPTHLKRMELWTGVSSVTLSESSYIARIRYNSHHVLDRTEGEGEEGFWRVAPAGTLAMSAGTGTGTGTDIFENEDEGAF